MSRNEQLQDLLDRWEELRADGNQVSVEELCRDCPELTDDLRRHLVALKAMAWLEESETEAADQPGEVSRSSSTLPLRVGDEPVPGYRLLGLLGRGGFGGVWKAIGPGGVEVALKVVPLSKQAGTVELRALDVVKNIRHPNLLAVFGAWQVNGLLIVAMELAERTLLDRFEEARQKSQSGTPRAELLEYLEDASRGIDFLNEPRHAHENGRMIGIQHRDIKPSNLVLVGGRVKVADFGLARLFTEKGTGHSGHMTPAYAAPEFFDGKMHARSDQYSLAVTYCLLRGGRLPFEGTAAEVMAGHLHREPDLSMLPEEECPAALRALAKQPTERWPNCEAFVNALRTSSASGLRSAREGYDRMLWMAG